MSSTSINALVQFGISLLFAIAALYLVFGYFRAQYIKKFGLDKDNFAFALYTSLVLVATAYLLSGVLEPISATNAVLKDLYVGVDLYLEQFKYYGLFMMLGFAICFTVLFIASLIFRSLTKGLDEKTEIKHDNKAVALIAGVVVLAISIIVKEHVVVLLYTFIPYPTSFHLTGL